jgi:hypothetical protein
MTIKALEISGLQPRDSSYKVADDHGLYLQIQPSGAKLWRLKFRFRGVEKKLALGKYPDVSLKDAREKRDEARRMLANGVDPAAAKRQAIIEATIGAATTFKLVADEFIEKMEREGKKAVTIKKAPLVPGFGRSRHRSPPRFGNHATRTSERASQGGEEGTSRDGAKVARLRWPCLSLCDRDDEGTIPPIFSAVRSRHRRLRTTRPFLIPSSSANCCARSRAIPGSRRR